MSESLGRSLNQFVKKTLIHSGMKQVFVNESFIESFAQPIGSKTPVENKTDLWVNFSHSCNQFVKN